VSPAQHIIYVLGLLAPLEAFVSNGVVANLWLKIFSPENYLTEVG